MDAKKLEEMRVIGDEEVKKSHAVDVLTGKNPFKTSCRCPICRPDLYK